MNFSLCPYCGSGDIRHHGGARIPEGGEGRYGVDYCNDCESWVAPVGLELPPEYQESANLADRTSYTEVRSGHTAVEIPIPSWVPRPSERRGLDQNPDDQQRRAQNKKGDADVKEVFKDLIDFRWHEIKEGGHEGANGEGGRDREHHSAPDKSPSDTRQSQFRNHADSIAQPWSWGNWGKGFLHPETDEPITWNTTPGIRDSTMPQDIGTGVPHHDDVGEEMNLRGFHSPITIAPNGQYTSANELNTIGEELYEGGQRTPADGQEGDFEHLTPALRHVPVEAWLKQNGTGTQLGHGPRMASVPDGYDIRPADEGWFSYEGKWIPRYMNDQDTLQTKHGQGQGQVAYHYGEPVASVTWQDNMLGSAYTHPDHRGNGLFNALSEPLRATEEPVDAYYWDNPWLRQKVRGWHASAMPFYNWEEEGDFRDPQGRVGASRWHVTEGDQSYNSQMGKESTWRESEYDGWSNWDTWSTKLMMDNEREHYDKARELAAQGATPEQIRDWALPSIIGPHNKDAIADAQGWNEIPQEERLDPHYEELKRKNPQAADLVDSLGMGADTSDSEPTLIDPELVNWHEIHKTLGDELGEEQHFENEDQRLRGMGLDFAMPGHSDEINQMLDAWMKHHGIMNKEQRTPDGRWAEHQTQMNVPIDQLKDSWGQNYYGPEKWAEYQQQGFVPRGVREHGWDTATDLAHGRATPGQTEAMQAALASQGHQPDQIAQIMRQRWAVGPTGVRTDLEAQPAQPDPSLDQPGELTLPSEWS